MVRFKLGNVVFMVKVKVRGEGINMSTNIPHKDSETRVCACVRCREEIQKIEREESYRAVVCKHHSLLASWLAAHKYYTYPGLNSLALDQMQLLTDLWEC